jgi:hypothetical protein
MPNERLGMGLFSAVVALLLSPAAITPATAQTRSSISKTELRSEAPGMTQRKLRDGFWQLLEKEDYRKPAKPHATLDLMAFQTKPRATHVRGQCRQDVLWVDYRPDDPEAHGPDAQVHPVGFTASSFYAFVDSPPDREGDDEDRPISGLQERKCAALPKDQPYFRADGDRRAWSGYRAWLALRDALASQADFPLKCELYPADKDSCGKVILAIPANHLASVDDCEPDGKIQCVAFNLDDRGIKLWMDQGRPVRAELESYLIFADERID